MRKKEKVVEINDKKITSKDVINFVSSLIGIFVFVKKLYDYNKNK